MTKENYTNKFKANLCGGCTRDCKMRNRKPLHVDGGFASDSLMYLISHGLYGEFGVFYEYKCDDLALFENMFESLSMLLSSGRWSVLEHMGMKENEYFTVINTYITFMRLRIWNSLNYTAQ